MKVINLYGAPSAGKSATMLGLTYYMKLMGLSVENSQEFFKELVFEEAVESTYKLGSQLSILSEQNKRLARLVGKNEFAVTDCPLHLVGYYTPEGYVKGFASLVGEFYARYDNVGYFILRRHEFEKDKRIHDEAQANKVESELPKYFETVGLQVKTLESHPDLVEEILADLIKSGVIRDELVEAAKQRAAGRKALKAIADFL